MDSDTDNWIMSPPLMSPILAFKQVFIFFSKKVFSSVASYNLVGFQFQLRLSNHAGDQVFSLSHNPKILILTLLIFIPFASHLTLRISPSGNSLGLGMHIVHCSLHNPYPEEISQWLGSEPITSLLDSSIIHVWARCRCRCRCR